MNSLVDIRLLDGKARVNSLQVAERFGKDHKSVLRAIDDLLSALPGDQRNFTPSFYQELQSVKKHRCFELDRDGFSLLAMGFTGSEALKWKLLYIQAFNDLEIAVGKPMSFEEHMFAAQGILASRVQKVEEHLGLTTKQERKTAQAVGLVIEHLQSARAALPTEADIPDGMLCPWDFLGEVEPEMRNERVSKGVAREAAKLFAGFAYGAGPKANWPRTAYPRDILAEAYRRYGYNMRYGRTEE